MPVTLEPATARDVERIRRIGIRAFTETFGAQNAEEDMAGYLDSAFAPDAVRAQLEDPESLSFLAVVDGEDAGYLTLNVGSAQTEDMGPDALEVQRIYALSGFKRQGVGTAMMDRAIAEARARGLRRIWLGVWEHNAPALRFYEHVGFRVTGSHEFVLGGDHQTDLIMELAMGE